LATTTTRLTIEDFERLPQEMADWQELVDGDLVDVSGNTGYHHSLRDFLIVLLLPFVRERRLGTVISEQLFDFDGNAHGPDVSFFGLEKQPLTEPNKRVQSFVPDLAIEVASANDTFNSLMRKKGRYRNCGTREVWIVSLESREVLVWSDRGDHILGGNAELSTPLIPGFQIPVKMLFETL
jgi:Uma2 family endonuclease